jgi:hypothetical protein
VSSEWQNNQRDRRASKRFSVDRIIRYRILGDGSAGVSGGGKTLNLSTSGMLIVTDRLLSPGMQLQVEVDWPLQEDAPVSLKLIAMCTVVRSEIGAIALAGLKITRHDFLTNVLER